MEEEEGGGDREEEVGREGHSDDGIETIKTESLKIFSLCTSTAICITPDTLSIWTYGHQMGPVWTLE